MTHTSIKHLFLLSVWILLLGFSQSTTFAYCPVGSTNCHIASCDTPASPLNYPLSSQQLQWIGMCDEPGDFGDWDINWWIYSWQCISSDSPSTTPWYPQHTSVANCSVAAKYNGVCGTANNTTVSSSPSTNLCNIGTPSSIGWTGPWTRSCIGANGGTTATCSANITTPTNSSGTCISCITAKCKDQFWNIVADNLCPIPVPTTGVISSPAWTQLRCPVGSNSYGRDIGPWSACSEDTTCNNWWGITTTWYIDRLAEPFAWLQPIPANWDAGNSWGRVYDDSHSVVMGCPFLLTTNYNMWWSNIQCFTSASSIPEDGSSAFNGTYYQIFWGNWYTIFVMNDIVITSILSSSGYGNQTTYPGTLWHSRCYGYNGGLDIAQVCSPEPRWQPWQENFWQNTNVWCTDIDADILPAHPGTNTVSLCIKAESCTLDPSIRTRTVVCKDNWGTGDIVDDSICSQPKPTTEDSSMCNIITDLQCGSTSNVASTTIPTTNLCTSPAIISWSVSLLNGVWQWQCKTRWPLWYSSNPTNGWSVTECIADPSWECYWWISNTTCTAPQNNTTVNYCGGANGQTLSNLSSSNTNLCAPWAFLQAWSFSTNPHSWEWHCAGSLNPWVTEFISLCSANQPTGTCSLDTTVGWGCFIADTIITMADGSKKSIQEIKVGDRLKSVDGDNTVKSLLRPLLGHQDIYSINNQDAFFTANHPFLTTQWWKSLDPDTTKKEIPDLEVTKLVIGDVLITENDKVFIMSIGKSSSDSSTQLYNFELDGDHTYFANGFAVHNKYEPWAEPMDLWSSCIKNSDCFAGVAGAYLACDNTTKTCKYAKPYPTFMCQMDSNGNITNWYNYGACGDWAEPNYVGSACPTGGWVDGDGWTCGSNGNWTNNGICDATFVGMIDYEFGYTPGAFLCLTAWSTPPPSCLCTASGTEPVCTTGTWPTQSQDGNTYTCQSNGWWSTAWAVCSPVQNPIDWDAGTWPDWADFFPWQIQCTTRQPNNCSCFTQPDLNWAWPLEQRC
jgi:hypothetical protein